jgi:TPR repeat protein
LENGFDGALISIGLCYLYGIEQNIRKAIECFEKLTNHKNNNLKRTACCELGCIYDNDQKFADKEKALHYYQLASDYGCELSMYLLCLLTYHDENKREQCMQYFKILQAQHEENVSDIIEKLLEQCYTLDLNNEEMLKYINIAARQGFKLAKELLRQHHSNNSST